MRSASNEGPVGTLREVAKAGREVDADRCVVAGAKAAAAPIKRGTRETCETFMLLQAGSTVLRTE